MSNQQLRAATGGAVAPAAKPPTTIAGLMSSPKVKEQMALALPKHMDADRLMRIALTELRRVPKLQTCQVESFMGAIMQCAQLGLEPGGALGHAYILPYEKRAKRGGQWVTERVEAQLIVGYRGMIDLARRSGQIVSIGARSVHQNDSFRFSYGIEETIEHTPADGDRGELTHVYAVARLKGGGYQLEVMSRADVDKIRARSKSKDSGPWVTDYEEMAKKTVVRRLFKYLPVSIELQRAVALDERADAGISQDNAALITGEFEPTGYLSDDAPIEVDTETGEIQADDEPTPDLE